MARGGKREGAGRKSKAEILAQAIVVADKGGAAEHAFARARELVDSKDEAIALKAAQIVMDRVWGKPLQRHEFGMMTDDELLAFIQGGIGETGAGSSGGAAARDTGTRGTDDRGAGVA
jgi:hypothetical protein